MTNKELIDILRTFPEDLEILINYEDYEDYKIKEIENVVLSEKVVYIITEEN